MAAVFNINTLESKGKEILGTLTHYEKYGISRSNKLMQLWEQYLYNTIVYDILVPKCHKN